MKREKPLPPAQSAEVAELRAQLAGAREALVQQRTSDFTRANEALLLGSLRQHELTEEAEQLNAQLRKEIAERQHVEAALRTSEILYRQLVTLLPVAVYTIDNEGFLTLFNRQAVQVFGREPQMGIDRWCGSYRLCHADGSPVLHEECPLAVELLERPCAPGKEIIIERPDGSRSWGHTGSPTVARRIRKGDRCD
jgi:PAS domain-containing protein